MGHLAKAIVAGLVTFGAQFQGALLDGSAGGQNVVQSEWVLIAVGTAVSAVAVWATSNTPDVPPVR